MSTVFVYRFSFSCSTHFRGSCSVTEEAVGADVGGREDFFLLFFVEAGNCEGLIGLEVFGQVGVDPHDHIPAAVPYPFGQVHDIGAGGQGIGDISNFRLGTCITFWNFMVFET